MGLSRIDNSREYSKIIIGTMRTAGLSEQETIDFLKGSLDEGVTAIDSADIYGGGKSEEMLGSAFAAEPSLRDAFWLQTKCGIARDGEIGYFDFSKEHILSAVEGSLQRLQTDHLDMLLLHRPDALAEPQEIAEAFDALYTQGKVLHFGVSNMNPIQIEMIASAVKQPIEADQMQLGPAFTPMIDAGFNVNNENEPAVMKDGGVLEYCRMRDIAVQAWSPFQHGYFAGPFLTSDKYEALNTVIRRIASERNVSDTAVVIAWILRIPGRTQVITGSPKLSRMKEAAQALTFTLSRKEWYEIYLAAGHKLP